MKVKCPRNFGKHFILSPQILSFVGKTSRHEKTVSFCLALLGVAVACSDKDDSVPRIQLAYENPNEVFDNENPRISLRAFETADGFARKFFFERFTPVRLSSGNRSDELFLSESNGGVSPDTRDFNSAPHFRCVVADRTSLYRERYPALEHAYHVQVVIEQYEGLTSEE